jgi:hypothetical protein
MTSAGFIGQPGVRIVAGPCPQHQHQSASSFRLQATRHPTYLIFVLAGHVAIQPGPQVRSPCSQGGRAGSRDICDAIPEHADREMISHAKREADRIDDQTVFSCQENLIIDTSY